MEKHGKVRKIINRFPESSNLADVLYEKFVKIYGEDESVREIIERIAAKVYKVKAKKTGNKFGENK